VGEGHIGVIGRPILDQHDRRARNDELQPHGRESFEHVRAFRGESFEDQETGRLIDKLP
jgi:hypothetical protein